jgi:hypothetical protein
MGSSFSFILTKGRGNKKKLKAYDTLELPREEEQSSNW